MQSYAAKIVPVFSCWSLALWNISTNCKAHNIYDNSENVFIL